MIKNFNSNRFIFWDWNARLFEHPEDLVRFFHEKKILGKRIRYVRVIGAVSLSHTPLGFSASEPLIIGLDNGLQLEIYCDEFGYCYVGLNNIPDNVKDGLNDSDIELTAEIKRQFIGKTIENISINRYPQGNSMDRSNRELSISLFLANAISSEILTIENDTASSTYFCIFPDKSSLLKYERLRDSYNPNIDRYLTDIFLYDDSDYFDIGCCCATRQSPHMTFYVQEDFFGDSLASFFIGKVKNNEDFEWWVTPNIYEYTVFLDILSEIEKSIVDTTRSEDNFKARFVFYARNLLKKFPSNSEVYVRGP